MKIKAILFRGAAFNTVVFECEHCHDTVQGNDYRDKDMAVKTISKMLCKKCGKQANDKSTIEILS